MKINEILNVRPVKSTAFRGIGKAIPDEILPAGIKTVDDDGVSYTWYGRQWVSDKTGRIATRNKGQAFSARELAKNHKGDVHVVFTNGWAYIYHGVPKSLYDQWMAAPSKGKFLHRHIRGFFDYTRNYEEDQR